MYAIILPNGKLLKHTIYKSEKTAQKGIQTELKKRDNFLENGYILIEPSYEEIEKCEVKEVIIKGRKDAWRS